MAQKGTAKIAYTPIAPTELQQYG